MALYKINLEIMPIQSVLDPQGEAIEVSLKNLDKIKASNFIFCPVFGIELFSIIGRINSITLLV